MVVTCRRNGERGAAPVPACPLRLRKGGRPCPCAPPAAAQGWPTAPCGRRTGGRRRGVGFRGWGRAPGGAERVWAEERVTGEGSETRVRIRGNAVISNIRTHLSELLPVKNGRKDTEINKTLYLDIQVRLNFLKT